MKKLIILSLFIGLISWSCKDANEDKELRYTQDSEEINTLKAAISDYEKGDWESMKSHYADTAQIFHNSKEGQDIDATINSHKESLTGLSNYGFLDEEEEFEMVLTDDDHTWVNYWGDWQGTISGSNEEIIIPVHLTARFVDGKIVREYGYWDNSAMMMAMQTADTTRTDTIN
ncbi:nuclear transport factor 2 family protein [Christiangramia crocea]|uniref:Nuclear transport factor 2 family protein n=1 Tax=Christiangramia crocea TaxID=2904124 RepID=A0A9X2A778_9FLAO|nr:nuclear transport factor 2 family protein [Gramella crocea]MCG9972735.1 nuclear transport factor 2 family protein [Gramella crocea]